MLKSFRTLGTEIKFKAFLRPAQIKCIGEEMRVDVYDDMLHHKMTL